MTVVSVWLTAAEVAAATDRHVVTVRRALENGELHGHQRVRGGRWKVKAESVEAWRTNQNTATACGCARLRSVRRAA